MTGTDWILGQTDRLLLRQPEEVDLPEIGNPWTGPRVTAHIGGPRDRSQTIAFFCEYTADPPAYAQDEGERWWSIVERAVSSRRTEVGDGAGAGGAPLRRGHQAGIPAE